MEQIKINAVGTQPAQLLRKLCFIIRLRKDIELISQIITVSGIFRQRPAQHLF